MVLTQVLHFYGSGQYILHITSIYLYFYDKSFIFNFLILRFKGNNPISTDSEDPHHIDVTDNTVKINRLVEDDAGRYTCKLFNANDKTEITQKDINVVCEYIIVIFNLFVLS